MRRSGLRLVTLAATLTVLLAAGALPVGVLGASAAYAGQWIQVSCVNPDQSAAPSQGWTSSAGGGTGDGSNNSTNCAPGSPMFAELSTAVAAPVGAGETLQYTPPAGSTLAGGNVDVSLYADGYGADASGTAVLYTPSFAYDASNVFFQCAAQLTPCANGTSDFSGVLALPAGRGGNLYCRGAAAASRASTATSAAATAPGRSSSCRGPTCCSPTPQHPPPAASAAACSPPTRTAPPTSRSPPPTPTDPASTPSPFRSTATRAYHATPNTNQGLCASVATDSTTGALMFDTQQPCLQTETVDIPIDTTTLADGQHDLKVIVTDAAQNSSTVLDQTITTQNSTTVSSLLPSPPASVRRARVLARAQHGHRAADTRGARGYTTAPSLRFAGTLKDSAGVAAPGVQVSLWAQPAAGGEFSEVAHTITDAAGAWTLTAPRGSSRLLHIVAGAKAQAASAANSVSVRETVTPLLTLHVTTPGGGRIVFSGRLAIAPLGAPRPLVFIQTRGPDGWEVVGSPIRVGPDGTFRYVYQSSPLTFGRSFSFRAVTPQTALWQAAQSQDHSAVVR